MTRIGILGAGAWGTALAQTARRAGLAVSLWAHEPEVAAAINRDHVNATFLPGIALDRDIRASTAVSEAVDADVVLLALPAQHLRAVLNRAAAHWQDGCPAVICAKGIEQASCALMSEVVSQALPEAPIAVLSGPSFAAEVARQLPTAVTLACRDERWRERLTVLLSTSRFRIYSTDDVIGAELGGAVKNVLAIACGIVEGRAFGDNARAALITRGLAEMARLALAKGARPETLMGLSGLGDLVLTCNAMQSRNYSLGVALGRGQPLAAVLAERTSVAEGVYSAAAVTTLAERLAVDMPICRAVDAVLKGAIDLDAQIEGLLSRPLRAEGWAAP